MGVGGLLSFLEDCPEACKVVSIDEMATKHKHLVGCDPVLVVDGCNVVSWIYANRKDSLECIYGGQWIQFKEILEEFVSKFERKGIKLVFIFDGTICEEKMTQWVKRRMDKYNDIANIFNWISYNLQDKVMEYRQVSSVSNLLAKFALKELDVVMHQTDKDEDADKYIANYANQNRAVFAILSNDAGFIILDTKPMLSTKGFILDELKTFMYDRYCLAERYLDLATDKLPLFACLMGDDYIAFDDIKKFHWRLVKGRKPFNVAKVKCICELIKRKEWTGQVDDKRELGSIAREVFGYESGLIKRSLESYAINAESLPLKICVTTSPAFEQVVHERHFNCSNACIFNVLCKKEYGSSQVLEDGTMVPSALVYREIRQRCYGILFNCSVEPDNLKSTVIEERCWYLKDNIKNDLNIPEKIHPLPLRNMNDVVNIEDLWLNYSERRSFEVFWHILQIPMEFQLLTKLPEDQVAISCILNYLIGGRESGPLLTPLDVAIFVAQAVWKPSSLEIKLLENPPVNAKAVNLSTLFTNGIEPVLMALETCGFPTPYEYALPWKFYDGKLFHFLYNEAKGNPKVQVLCNNKDKIIAQFYQLLLVVTDQTKYHPDRFEWINVLKDFKLKKNTEA